MFPFVLLAAMLVLGVGYLLTSIHAAKYSPIPHIAFIYQFLLEVSYLTGLLATWNRSHTFFLFLWCLGALVGGLVLFKKYRYNHYLTFLLVGNSVFLTIMLPFLWENQ